MIFKALKCKYHHKAKIAFLSKKNYNCMVLDKRTIYKRKKMICVKNSSLTCQHKLVFYQVLNQRKN